MPKRRAARGAGKPKHMPPTPHGPVLEPKKGKGKRMKGGGFFSRLPSALLHAAPQLALGIATENPYFAAQGVSTLVSEAADREDADVLNRGPGGDVANALGQLRMWRGPSRRARVPRSAPTAEPVGASRGIVPRGVSDPGIDKMEFERAFSRRAAAPMAPVRPSLRSRMSAAASDFAARSRAIGRQVRYKAGDFARNVRARVDRYRLKRAMPEQARGLLSYDEDAYPSNM